MKELLCTKFHWILFVYLFLFLYGCTTLQPVELTPEELQSKIRTEGLIKEDDQVEIHTIDGQEYEFYVRSVDDEYVKGSTVTVFKEYHETINIDDIVALKTGEFSGGKTALFAGGLAAGSLAIIYIGLAVGVIGLGF